MICNAGSTGAVSDQDWHVRSKYSPSSVFCVVINVQLLACSPPITALSIIQNFEASLSHLWSIWECLVLCEPIIIFGQSPAWTSNAIWWLRDVIRPVRALLYTCRTVPQTRHHVIQIPWAGDFRPYFTIHDKEHKTLVNEKAPKAGLLLGVTNPFFEKTCSHWPHVLTLGGKSRWVLANIPFRWFWLLFPAVQTPQRVSLVQHLDGKQKNTNGIRLRTASSSGRWKQQQRVEMRKRVSLSFIHDMLRTHAPLRPSGRSVFQPPPSLLLSFCGATSSPQPVPKHAYPPTLWGKHGFAPQVLQQRKFLRLAQDAWSGTALQVKCETARVLRAMATDTSVRHMAREAGRHCYAYAGKRKEWESVLIRSHHSSCSDRYLGHDPHYRHRSWLSICMICNAGSTGAVSDQGPAEHGRKSW